MISEPLRNPLSLFDVKDKVAIITGASGTFGRATALALTSLGGKVVLASGSKAELDEVAGEDTNGAGQFDFSPAPSGHGTLIYLSGKTGVVAPPLCG